MKWKTLLPLVFTCFISTFSIGQDHSNLLLKSGLKVHLSTGGMFLKNMETEFLESSSPFVFVSGGIEAGQKYLILN